MLVLKCYVLSTFHRTTLNFKIQKLQMIDEISNRVFLITSTKPKSGALLLNLRNLLWFAIPPPVSHHLLLVSRINVHFWSIKCDCMATTKYVNMQCLTFLSVSAYFLECDRIESWVYYVPEAFDVILAVCLRIALCLTPYRFSSQWTWATCI